jgi:hypothetical protein
MSAFVVEKAHIDYLIAAGLCFGRPHRLKWSDPTTPAPRWDGGSDTAFEAHSAAVQARVRELAPQTADRVGRMLWEQNHRSVSGRYSELQTMPGYEFGADTEYAQVLGRFPDGWRWCRVMLEPVSVLKALSCYEYQASETLDWEQTEARAFCDALRSAAIAALPGYEAAPWNVRDAEDMATAPGEPSVEVRA